MGANDRSFKYSVGKWGRKARKLYNNLRRQEIKEETVTEMLDSATSENFTDFEPEDYIELTGRPEKVYAPPEVDWTFLIKEIELENKRLKQEVRELKRDLKNSKQETKKWQDKWWDECFKYGR